MPPRIMIVSAWRFQHSPMFGQHALSQTVCSPSSATRFLRSKKTSPVGIFIRIQSGFGWNAGAPSAAWAARPARLEDAQLARPGFDDAGRHFGCGIYHPDRCYAGPAHAAGVKLAGGGRHRRDSVRPRTARPRRAWPWKHGRAEHHLGSRGGVSPGTLREAAAKYEAAFALRPDPALLYNAAQSHRLAGNKPRALELYRDYVRLYPDGASAEDARGHVSALKKVVEDHRARYRPARRRRLRPRLAPPTKGRCRRSLETPAPPRRRQRRRRHLRRGTTRACRSCPVPRPRRQRRSARSPSRRGSGWRSEQPSRWWGRR